MFPFLKDKFTKNVLLLSSGAALGQLIAFGATPIITRLYSPEELGLFSIYAAIIAFLVIIASLRYELAIPIPETEEEVVNIVALCLMILLCFCGIVSLVVFFTPNLITRVIKNPSFLEYLWILPFGVFFAGLYNIFNYWAIRTKKFKIIFRTKLFASVLSTTITLLFSAFSSLTLIIGNILGQSAGVFSLMKSFKETMHLNYKLISKERVLSLARRYIKFPLFSTSTAFINSSGSQLPFLLFAGMFSAEAAGVFYIANRIMAVPVKMIGKAVGQTFLAEAAQQNRVGDLYGFSIGVVKKLALVTVVPVILVLLFSDLIPVILGDQWDQVENLARWMVFIAVAQFVTYPVGHLLAIVEQQQIGVYLQLVLTSLKLSGIATGYYFGDFLMAVKFYSILGGIGYLIFLYYSLHVTKTYKE